MPAYGRGGAGNHEAAVADQQRIKEDVEAQKAVVAAAEAGPSQHPQFARTGRGGAGNLISPTELAATGTFVQDQSAGKSTDPPQDAPTRGVTRTASGNETIPFVQRMVGRGGAGNFGWSNYETDENDQTAEAEAEKKRQIEQSVAREVQDELAPPPKARVPHELVK